MGSTFNPQILVDKLAKLNNSQQSIETLSHWCIFHMNKAKQVVETWDRQFHSSPREQHLAFLYLANDILQNSRRKGSEFVAEFWKVLPDALRDVIESGDDFGRNAALRLINIWDDRKVFGSRGQILKEEFVGRHMDGNNRNENHSGLKLRPAAGNMLEKIVSGYQVLYGGHLDEDAILNKCRSAISCIEKVDNEIGSNLRSGHINESHFMEELKGQHEVLRDCVEQLTAVESSRANLVSRLREALQEQEYKLEQVRDQLQAAQSHSEEAESICQQLVNNNSHITAEQSQKEIHMCSAPKSFMSGHGEQSAPLMYAKKVPFAEKSGDVEEDHKSKAAAVAAKLTASTSSAQMLSYVLSSLASEGVIGNALKERPSDYPSEKRAKLENDHSYIPPQTPQAALAHTEALQNNLPVTSQELVPNEQPPPPTSPPPLPPLPPMQPYAMPPYTQTAGQVGNGPYGYGTMQQQTVSMVGYPQFGHPMNGVPPFAAASPANTYQSYPAEGGFYGHPSSLPMAPITRQ